MGKVINVEGIIGAGKTTLVESLEREYMIDALYEPVDDNPFLAKFYDDPKGVAFKIQMWLLSRRHDANKAAFWLARTGKDVIVDRGRLGDRCFACANNVRGNIDDDEMAVYDDFFTSMDARDPDVIVYLDITVSQALKRIGWRGRDCEKDIDPDYLDELRNQHDRMTMEAGKRGVEIIKIAGDHTVEEVARALNLTARGA
jgi:NADH dehydrogenase (ubiquinone) 1 alpha subcomplex subunit 10